LANPLEVRVGKTVVVTPWQHQRLTEHAYEMRQLAHHGRVGWLKEYMERHLEVGRILKEIIGLSHQD